MCVLVFSHSAYCVASYAEAYVGEIRPRCTQRMRWPVSVNKLRATGVASKDRKRIVSSQNGHDNMEDIATGTSYTFHGL